MHPLTQTPPLLPHPLLSTDRPISHDHPGLCPLQRPPPERARPCRLSHSSLRASSHAEPAAPAQSGRSSGRRTDDSQGGGGRRGSWIFSLPWALGRLSSADTLQPTRSANLPLLVTSLSSHPLFSPPTHCRRATASCRPRPSSSPTPPLTGSQRYVAPRHHPSPFPCPTTDPSNLPPAGRLTE